MARDLVTCPKCGTQFKAKKGHPILGTILGVAAGVAATIATGGGGIMLAICAIGGGAIGNGMGTKYGYQCPKCKEKFSIPEEGDDVDNSIEEIQEQPKKKTEKKAKKKVMTS